MLWCRGTRSTRGCGQARKWGCCKRTKKRGKICRLRRFSRLRGVCRSITKANRNGFAPSPIALDLRHDGSLAVHFDRFGGAARQRLLLFSPGVFSVRRTVRPACWRVLPLPAMLAAADHLAWRLQRVRPQSLRAVRQLLPRMRHLAVLSPRTDLRQGLRRNLRRRVGQRSARLLRSVRQVLWPMDGGPRALLPGPVPAHPRRIAWLQLLSAAVCRSLVPAVWPAGVRTKLRLRSGHGAARRGHLL